MANLKTRAEIEAKKQSFIAGSADLWTVADLNRLTDGQLVDRLEQIEGQSFLIKCRILWELRQRFASDRLFGQYLVEISSTRQFLAGSQSSISSFIAVGRFCEQQKLSDLNQSKISKGSICKLSMMSDADAAVKILQNIRQKNVPLREVERMIEQSKAVATIEQPEVVAHDQEAVPRIVQVIDNQAMEVIELSVLDVEPVNTELSRAYIVNAELSDEDMAEEIYLFCKKFPISFMRLASVVKLLLTKVTMRGYGK